VALLGVFLFFLASSWGPSADPVAVAVLEVVNAERERVGVPPLELVDYGFAELRARDMAELGYFGHCRPDGTLFLELYTGFGGVYYVEDNVGVYWGGSVEEAVVGLVEAMLFEDEESGWAHRRSLLDPYANKLEVGYAVSDGVVFVAFEVYKVWVDWSVEPHYDGVVFEARGRLLLDAEPLGVRLLRVPVLSGAWPSKNGIIYTCGAWLVPETVGFYSGAAWSPSPGEIAVRLDYALPPGDGYVYYVVVLVEKEGVEVPVLAYVLGRGG